MGHGTINSFHLIQGFCSFIKLISSNSATGSSVIEYMYINFMKSFKWVVSKTRNGVTGNDVTA